MFFAVLHIPRTGGYSGGTSERNMTISVVIGVLIILGATVFVFARRK